MPIAAGIETPDGATLMFSAVAALLAVAGAAQPPSIRKTGVAALAMALLAVLVVLHHGSVLLTAALLLAAFGEALLVQEQRTADLSGLGAEFAARVVYCVLFAAASQPRLLESHPWRAAAVAAVAIGVAWLLRRIWPHAGALRWPAVVYGVAVLVMCATAAAVAPPPVLAGAMLLAAADAGAAGGRFGPESGKGASIPLIRVTFLARYLGQALVVLSGLALI